MSKITAFDKVNLKTVRVDVDAALEAVAKKYGIVLRLGNISFSAGEFTSKVTARVDDGSVPSNVNPKWVTHFQRNGKSLFVFAGVTPYSLGTEVKNGNTTYRLVGSRNAKQELVLQVNGSDRFVQMSVSNFAALASKK